MFLARLSVSGRFLLVLVIGFAFQAGISIVSLRDLKRSLVQDRVTEVKHLLEVAYSDVVYYHEQARQGRMSDAQARAAAADALRSLHYDGTNYFFVWDLNGTSIAHGAQPALEGKTFINSPDAERNPVVAYMVARLLEVARSPDKEGVSTYRIPKRGEKVPLEKIAYSKLFEPWGWSIGTGAYVDDIEEAFSARALSLLWEHPRLGLVAPSEFIPMAEETGLILPLGRLVLETACRQMAAWARQPLTAALQIAVNVSARQFQQPDFADQVIEALRTTGADPRRLTLELTESLFVNNIDDVTRKMELLKRQGIRFALDDFGTGYSSLHYLKRLPLDQIKIDRSFVRDVLIDPDDAAIAKTILVLAQTLGLEALAEGIETLEQWEFLARSGCRDYQGYYFSRPLPLPAFESFLINQAAARLALDTVS